MGNILVKTNLQRIAFLKGSDNQRYITTPVRYSTISSEDLINYACENSGIPKAQMASAFYAINQQIEQFILNGHSLTLGNLGNLYLSTRTRATVSENDAGADAVRQIYVRFRQSRHLKTLLNANATLSTLRVLTTATSGTGGSTGSSDSDGSGTGDSGDSGGGSTGETGSGGDDQSQDPMG